MKFTRPVLSIKNNNLKCVIKFYLPLEPASVCIDGEGVPELHNASETAQKDEELAGKKVQFNAGVTNTDEVKYV